MKNKSATPCLLALRTVYLLFFLFSGQQYKKKDLKLYSNNNVYYVYNKRNQVKPSYHISEHCDRIKQDYKDFRIPEEVLYYAYVKLSKKYEVDISDIDETIKNAQSITDWKNYFDSLDARLQKNKIDKVEIETEKECFANQFSNRFKELKKSHSLDEIAELMLPSYSLLTKTKFMEQWEEKPNSGAIDIDNFTVEDLEQEIKSFYEKIKEYRNNEEDVGNVFEDYNQKKYIIEHFRDKTFLADREKYPEIRIPHPLNDNDLRNFLKTYESKYKKPFKDLCRKYFQKKYSQNKNASMPRTVLDQLGFVPCACMRSTAGATLKNSPQNNNMIDCEIIKRIDSIL